MPEGYQVCTGWGVPAIQKEGGKNRSRRKPRSDKNVLKRQIKWPRREGCCGAKEVKRVSQKATT